MPTSHHLFLALLLVAAAPAWADDADARTPAESVIFATPSDAGLATETLTEVETGIASWYGQTFHRKRTASGEPFDAKALTAAHPTLPFGTWVQVTLLSTGRSVIVRITDRGPHIANRLIDLSRAAAAKIGLIQRGAGTVKVEPVAEPPPIR